jgi:hypothetical protein
VRILLIKESFFIFGLETIFIIELLESSISVVSSIFVGKLVIVVSTGWVRQHEISLTYVRELLLSGNSVRWVLLRMPVSSELLIGVFNLGLGGFAGETQGCIVVFVLMR